MYFISQKLLLNSSRLWMHAPFTRTSTVYALSSGHGRCGVSVIRITGDETREAILKMTRPQKLPKARRAVLRTIHHSISGEPLDRGLILWFPAPNSFTGEDSAEFQIHGGVAVVTSVLSSLGSIQNFHPAQPGDFTKRAFYNNKMDLTQVEGLGDLIHAETEAQHKQALCQMGGALSQLYSKWRDDILNARANLEAFIDFSDEENIEPNTVRTVSRIVKSLIFEIKLHLQDSRKGERLRHGLKIVIVGRPNVGKSSLLNGMVRRQAAIVSTIEGTTRDILEIPLNLAGYPIIVNDTAGLRFTVNEIEKEGVRRALEKVTNADIAIIMVDAEEILHHSLSLNGDKFNFKHFLYKYFHDVGIFKWSDINPNEMVSYEWFKDNNFLVLVNKIDKVNEAEKVMLCDWVKDKPCSLLSLETNEGFRESMGNLKELCSRLCSSGNMAESPHLTSARHRTHIEECLNHLISIVEDESELNFSNQSEENTISGLLAKDDTLAFAAQQLQLAASQLGAVSGHITSEDVLDKIFSSFCIGK